MRSFVGEELVLQALLKCIDLVIIVRKVTTYENRNRCNGRRSRSKGCSIRAMKAIKEYSDLHITLVGKKRNSSILNSDERITILHTDEKIESTEEPVRAVRRKNKLQWRLRHNK